MDIIYWILLVSIAGPVIGSAIGVLRKPSELFMFNMLSFAAGVMLTISLYQLIPSSIKISSGLFAVLGLTIGAITMYFIDKLVPHLHHVMGEQEHGQKLERTAIYLILGIFMHNFPEGMAIATGTINGFNAAISIAIAIAIHNIAEGICTSAPYYYTNKNRLKAFLVSSTTAIPVLAGFYFAHTLFQNIPIQFIGAVTAATAGIMIYISCDELIPTSCNKCNTFWNHSMIFSLMAGVVFVIILSLL